MKRQKDVLFFFKEFCEIKVQESFKMEILDVIGVERKSEGKTRGSDVKKTRRELQRFKFRHCVLSIYCFALI